VAHVGRVLVGIPVSVHCTQCTGCVNGYKREVVDKLACSKM